MARSMPASTPAAAVRKPAITQVQRTMRSRSMPRAAASAGLSETARVARPSGVWQSTTCTTAMAAITAAAGTVAEDEAHDVLEHEGYTHGSDEQCDRAALAQRAKHRLIDPHRDHREHGGADRGGIE